MKIGTVAKVTRTQPATIRFYERVGLLPSPRRSGNDYRIYSDSDVDQLSFIRRCRSLDMNLNEIRVLLRAKEAPDVTCDEVNALLDSHIDDLSKRIDELNSLNGELRALRKLCSEGTAADQCGILNELSSSLRVA